MQRIQAKSNPETFFVPKQQVSKDPFLHLTDRIVKWVHRVLFNNYEKELDFVGRTATVLDWGLFGVVMGTEAGVLANNLFHLHLEKSDILSKIPSIVRSLAFPLSLLFFTFALIEGIAELANLKRTYKFLGELSKDSSVENKLIRIQEKYFSVHQKEKRRLTEYLEKQFPYLSDEKKKEKAKQIESKILELKLETLSRRITPGLAKEVSKELDSILEGLKSGRPKEAQKRAECLIESLNKQAKMKVLVHLLGLASIAITLICLTGMFFNVVTPMIVLSLISLSMCFTLISLIIKHGAMNKEPSFGKDRVNQMIS